MVRRGFLKPKQESGRRQHRHHRPPHAFLKGMLGLAIDRLGQPRQPAQRPLIHRPPERPSRKPFEQFPRINPTLNLSLRRFAREEKSFIVPRRSPMLALERSFDLHRRHNGLRRLQILLQQQRRNRQHIPHRVESVASVIRRKLLQRVIIDPHQIPDRVPIFNAVQPPQRHPPRVGILLVDPKGLPFDPVVQCRQIGHRGLRPVARRHQPCPHVLQHRQP